MFEIGYIAPDHGLPSKGMSEQFVCAVPMLPTCMQIAKVGYNKHGDPIWKVLCREFMQKREAKQFIVPYTTNLPTFHNLFVPKDVDTSCMHYILESEYWMQFSSGYCISLPRILHLIVP